MIDNKKIFKSHNFLLCTNLNYSDLETPLLVLFINKIEYIVTWTQAFAYPQRLWL